MITVTRGGDTATIDEELNVAANNETLLSDLQDDIDFVIYGGAETLSPMLQLYEALKKSVIYDTVDAPKELLDELKKDNDRPNVIF